VFLGHHDHLGHFLSGVGEHDAGRLPVHQGSIPRIEIELYWLLQHPVITQDTTKIPDEAHRTRVVVAAFRIAPTPRLPG
jgi:hypothetical protein